MGREWQLSLVGVIAYIVMLLKVNGLSPKRLIWLNCAGAEIPESKNAGWVKQGCGVGRVYKAGWDKLLVYSELISSSLTVAEPSRCQNIQWPKSAGV